QSGAVLWLRHSFARAFSGNFVMLSEAKHLYLSLRASPSGERGNQQAKNPNTFDCHEAKASRNDPIERVQQPNTFDCNASLVTMLESS
ncbi:MAG: hypothetical protein K2M51_00860, partial [Helicobacter sp.]|nr:hypothetical protein [Helicobacter sp.]